MRKVALVLTVIFMACSIMGCASLGLGKKCAETDMVSSSGMTYVVEKGDTLYKISRKFNVPVDSIAQANNIRDKDVITVGAVLDIPKE